MTTAAPPDPAVGPATGAPAGPAGAAARTTAAAATTGAAPWTAGAAPRTAAAAAGTAGATAGATGAAARPGLVASASIVADLDAGRPRIRWTHAWPIVLRPTGQARVHLVHGAGGPLGGDLLRLDVRVGAEATLAVRSAGATLVQPGRSGQAARWDTGAVVDTGATLDWGPEPTVVTDAATYHTSLRADLGEGARATIREVVVLGRHRGIGGRYRGRLDVTVDGAPLLTHTTVLDGADPALGGPGGSAGARAVGTLVVAGSTDPAGAAAPLPGIGGPTGEDPRIRWAWTELDGPGRMLLAVGEPGAVIALLDAAAALLSRAGSRP